MTSERTANRIIARRDEMQDRLRELSGPAYEVQVLREQFAGVVQDLLKFEDEGWLKLFGSADDSVKGFTLKDVKEVTKYLEKQTKILGDLLGRGLRLKNNHVFGRGFSYEPTGTTDRTRAAIPPRHVKVIEDPHNQEILFSPTALKEINRIFFTSGNLFLMYDRSSRTWKKLAVDVNIQNYIAFDDDPARIKYYLRSWTKQSNLADPNARPEMQQEWVPTAAYDATGPRYPKHIRVGTQNVPVNANAVIVDRRMNRDNGEVWGVADAFAAAAPAHVYATAMKDGAMLQHALAAIAFVVKAKTQNAAKTAGAKLQRDRVGQAAITGPETEIASMPRAGQINLYESRPLVARVASALDVSTTGITSDPGPGGSYASENALSQPEQMAALSRQEDFANLFAEIFRVMGIEAKINFNRLDVDPVHRQLQSIGLARQYGFIHQAEGRNRALELLDIEPTSEKMPEPDEFTGSKYSTLAEQVDKLAKAADAAAQGSAVPSQGNSGAVGSLDDDNSARDADNNSGTA